MRSDDVSAQIGCRVYDRMETAQRLGRSLRTIERWIDAGTLGYIVYHNRIYVSEEQIRECEARATYVQPPLPGLGPDEEFTDEQGAAVARVIDGNRARRARSRVKGKVA